MWPARYHWKLGRVLFSQSEVSTVMLCFLYIPSSKVWEDHKNFINIYKSVYGLIFWCCCYFIYCHWSSVSSDDKPQALARVAYILQLLTFETMGCKVSWSFGVVLSFQEGMVGLKSRKPKESSRSALVPGTALGTSNSSTNDINMSLENSLVPIFEHLKSKRKKNQVKVFYAT